MISLITGGSGSGKSEFAEQRVLSFGEKKRIYIATMIPYDEECKERIARHKAMRADKKFHTIECYTGLKETVLEKDSVVLLECMSNLVANEMYQENGAKERTVEEIMEGIRSISKKVHAVVIVSNEVFSDGICYEEESMRYLSYLGKVNKEIGRMADEVIEVAYSIPIYHKGSRR